MFPKKPQSMTRPEDLPVRLVRITGLHVVFRTIRGVLFHHVVIRFAEHSVLTSLIKIVYQFYTQIICLIFVYVELSK